MRLDNEFTVGVPIGQAWGVLTDLELIAPCMPGAQLTGVNDGVYTGKVKIKVGPVTAEYSGTAQFSEKDDESYRAVIDARGRDSRGNGNASAVISAQLTAAGESTRVSVTTDLTIAGRIAQFGGGMIKEVSAKLLGQFVDCLEDRLGGDLTDGGELTVTPALTATSGATTPVPAAQAPAGTAPAGAATAASAPAGAAAAASAPADTAAAQPEPAALDLMSVAGRAIYKRVIPVVVVAAIVIALAIYFGVR